MSARPFAARTIDRRVRSRSRGLALCAALVGSLVVTSLAAPQIGAPRLGGAPPGSPRPAAADPAAWLPPLPAVSLPVESKQVQGWVVPFGAPVYDLVVEPNGIVRLCQPTLVSLTRFDPKAETFTLHNPGFIGPQGVALGAGGVLWEALTAGGPPVGKLDEFDPSAGTDVHHPLPYPSAKPTKVLVSGKGTIWVLDSSHGRVSEFEPRTRTWLQSLVVPTFGAYPVSIAEDPETGTLYATCSEVDTIAIFAPGQPPKEIATPPSRPRVCVWSQGLLYYVLDNQPKLLTYDPATGLQKSYVYGLSWDPASAVVAMPDGRIVVGTHNEQGNLHVFDPRTKSFTKYVFPPSWKGNVGSRMAVGPSGELWLTKWSVSNPTLLIRLYLP